MKFSIAQIGENRLKRVLVEDKGNTPKQLCEVLEKDFLNVLNSYVEDARLKIEPMQVDNEIVFNVVITCKRVKSFGVLA